MGYYIDLENISLDEYKNILKTRYLIPSHMVLRDNIDKNFDTIIKAGFNNMGSLLSKLKTKKKAEEFAKILGLPLDYVVVLRRELGGRIPPARKLNDYPSINDSIKTKLNELNIKTSKDLYEFILTKKDRTALMEKLDSSEEEIMHISKLMDVTRLRYVSPLFATLLASTSCDTVEKLSKANPDTLFGEITNLNRDNRFFKGNLGKNDIKFLIEDTEYVSFDIEF